MQKNVLYVRNHNDGFGTWQTVFQTTDRAVVEEYCRRNAIEFEWKGDRLKTLLSPLLPNTLKQGKWFGSITLLFSMSTLEPTMREALL